MAIISLQHGFIFIKTTKTAGTSIETDLSPLAGPDAVATPIYPPEPGHVPRNHAGPDGGRRFYNHMPAAEIREQIGAERFAAMYRFCVEREPVAKCISHFHMLRNSPLHNPDGAYRLSWQEYCAAGKFPVDLHRYSAIENGRRILIVDHVLRYDALQAQLAQVMQHLGISGFALIARAKSGYGRNVLIRREEVTPEQEALILEAFRPAQELTGIDWDAPPPPLKFAAPSPAAAV